MKRSDIWKVWHECKKRLEGADNRQHEQFDENWPDFALTLLTDSQLESVAAYMRQMASDYEEFGSVNGDPTP